MKNSNSDHTNLSVLLIMLCMFFWLNEVFLTLFCTAGRSVNRILSAGVCELGSGVKVAV